MLFHTIFFFNSMWMNFLWRQHSYPLLRFYFWVFDIRYLKCLDKYIINYFLSISLQLNRLHQQGYSMSSSNQFNLSYHKLSFLHNNDVYIRKSFVNWFFTNRIEHSNTFPVCWICYPSCYMCFNGSNHRIGIPNLSNSCDKFQFKGCNIISL